VIRCELCSQEIEEPKSAWRQSVGWVSPNGAKAMTGATQTGKLAHATCVVRLREGLNARQESLV
jgi:hypothetical protein